MRQSIFMLFYPNVGLVRGSCYWPGEMGVPGALMLCSVIQQVKESEDRVTLYKNVYSTGIVWGIVQDAQGL